MNDVESLLEAQTTALLRRLGREQESRTRHIRDEAGTQAADIVRRARVEARTRVHQAVVDTRREDSDGRVNRPEYCAKLGAGLHRNDRQYCCSGKSVRAPWPLSEVRRRLYFCE